MKFALTCKLPNHDKRLQSAAWLLFRTNADRMILRMKVEEAKKK